MQTVPPQNASHRGGVSFAAGFVSAAEASICPSPPKEEFVSCICALAIGMYMAQTTALPIRNGRTPTAESIASPVSASSVLSAPKW